ncbi:hypothetical protein COLO4_18520 [Corchorus olitorius]|uniref:Uncharacterized protein n=1 Tax=Corchorus olitorius TaxID=93759 RepID=A0A1R3J8P5_9ROSI|nr:hypothetical protein COLO4_18520 [Corchorus olitorius]
MAEDQQKMDLKELEMKHAADHTSVSLSTLLKERDELLEFHAEVRRTFQNIRESMQKMSVENKRVANHLREQLGTLEQGRKTLLKRKLLPEITMNETANFVTDKIVSKLEEDEKVPSARTHTHRDREVELVPFHQDSFFPGELWLEERRTTTMRRSSSDRDEMRILRKLTLLPKFCTSDFSSSSSIGCAKMFLP